MEERNKKERKWPIYTFLTIIIFLLFMILISIYYFCSVFYSWAQYSLEKDGYFVKDEVGNEIIIDNNTINNTVD